MKQSPITRTIWILSFVSLCTDVASEMLYPIMPVYLKSIGFSIVLIGVLEGVAEAVAGLSKGYFGKLSDVSGKRLPFVRTGYLMSALSKPMLGFLAFPVWIFFARTLDRLGKGVRTGARDAILSDESTPQTKGTVFGFHRGMDTLGAALGPVLALVYLYAYPGNYRMLFFLAFVPGMLGVLLAFLLKEKKKAAIQHKRTVSFLESFRYLRAASEDYKKLLLGLMVFTLFNSSDVFLLLMVKHRGFSDAQVILLYIFYNVVYALFAFPLGRLADKIGLKNTLMAGLFFFAMVYAGMAGARSIEIFYFLFFLYGIYAASTEGISKALISNIAEKKDTAVALGTYAGFNSVFTMLASSVAGLIWYLSGPALTFIISAMVALAVVIYLGLIKIRLKTG